jgi:Domain of unknown function (DUF4365)
MAHAKRRPLQHVMEDESVKVLQRLLPKEWVIRPYHRDYGIDFIVELFNYVDEERRMAETLGEHVFLQLKSVLRTEIETVAVSGRGNVAKGALQHSQKDSVTISVIKFQIDTDELLTVETMGPGVPVLLVLVTLDQSRAFFVCLNDLIDKVIIPEEPQYADKGTKVVYVPAKNEITGDPISLTGIRFYGKRAKIYSAFSLFEYQRNELSYAAEQPSVFEPMLRHFVRVLERLDIWDADVMGLFGCYWSELQKMLARLDAEGCCPYVVAEAGRIWTGLVAVSHTFEECWREWFLPTYLAQLLSYPGSAEFIAPAEGPSGGVR